MNQIKILNNFVLLACFSFCNAMELTEKFKSWSDEPIADSPTTLGLAGSWDWLGLEDTLTEHPLFAARGSKPVHAEHFSMGDTREHRTDASPWIPYRTRRLSMRSCLAAHLYRCHRDDDALKPFQCALCHETFAAASDGVSHVIARHKTTGICSCPCVQHSYGYTSWVKHIERCPLRAQRLTKQRHFWCPCGYACTETEALKHQERCLRAKGMVFVNFSDIWRCEYFLQALRKKTAQTSV